MTIHVNIGEAKTRFSELVKAAVRGEDVIVSRAGKPQVKIVSMEEATREERKRIAARRVANIGYAREAARGLNFDVPPSMTEAEIDARERRILDPGP